MRKIMYFIPLFSLLGLALVVGVLYLIIPKIVVMFFIGFWFGIKAPVVIVANAFGAKFVFFENRINSNSYNLGFLFGIFFWSSTLFVPHKIQKVN